MFNKHRGSVHCLFWLFFVFDIFSGIWDNVVVFLIIIIFTERRPHLFFCILVENRLKNILMVIFVHNIFYYINCLGITGFLHLLSASIHTTLGGFASFAVAYNAPIFFSGKNMVWLLLGLLGPIGCFAPRPKAPD